MCVASGPGKDMFESTKIIAERQYDVSKALLDNEDGNWTPSSSLNVF